VPQSSIIGGPDGPTSICIASALSPELLGAIAVAAYSYMALVPVNSTSHYESSHHKEERRIVMPQLRKRVKKRKLILPNLIVNK